jgi:hypothetical protein
MSSKSEDVTCFLLPLHPPKLLHSETGPGLNSDSAILSRATQNLGLVLTNRLFQISGRSLHLTLYFLGTFLSELRELHLLRAFCWSGEVHCLICGLKLAETGRPYKKLSQKASRSFHRAHAALRSGHSLYQKAGSFASQTSSSCIQSLELAACEATHHLFCLGWLAGSNPSVSTEAPFVCYFPWPASNRHIVTLHGVNDLIPLDGDITSQYKIPSTASTSPSSFQNAVFF